VNDDRRTKRTLGFSDLKKWLRHRHPMVLLDRILDYEPAHYLTALLSVSGNLDCVSGHFPERAIYPGSHLIQAVAQAGIILFQMSTTPLADNELTLISSMESRFFKVIVPGDQVELSARVDRLRGNVLHFSCKAVVATVRVAAFRATIVRTEVNSLGAQLW
jgi:3-hydroxyacyl-[acyl-carrier-protein] dehydratase